MFTKIKSKTQRDCDMDRISSVGSQQIIQWQYFLSSSKNKAALISFVAHDWTERLQHLSEDKVLFLLQDN